ncbi:Bax inhibitor-1 family protein [Pontibacillus sp. HMF3514]|uniref:Bax inhibitor-1/YccA family protein n=1 Tax=Pontibacillus sp. HMF3514 TaxID=2692425 RepID=UPI00131F5E4B|nr:Bax inhibitor-1 family protein [Pontibacillus sp. HMF3514]QHE50800.1 BAX inhibitor (BI)-1/YccA family protein [Pontibacillus sp. HMF3514]
MQKGELLAAVLRTFAISIGFALIGLFAGQWVPPALFLPLIILEFILLIVVFFVRKAKKISYSFLFFFTFISGLTLFPVMSYYVSSIGAYTVLVVFGVTAVIFTVLSIYAWKTKRDLSFMGGMLMSALLALILVWIIHMIFNLGGMAILVITIISILIFSGFIIYDINKIKHGYHDEKDIPLLALNLYLDFLNLFLDLLRLVKILSDD